MKRNHIMWIAALMALLMVLPFYALATQEDPAQPGEGDVNVYPEHTLPKTYTIKFVDYDGTVIQENTYDYGEEILIPSDPVRPNSDGIGYVFDGWDKEISTVCIATATYTARYKSTGANSWV